MGPRRRRSKLRLLPMLRSRVRLRGHVARRGATLARQVDGARLSVGDGRFDTHTNGGESRPPDRRHADRATDTARLAWDIRGTSSDGSAAKIGRSPEIQDLRGSRDAQAEPAVEPSARRDCGHRDHQQQLKRRSTSRVRHGIAPRADARTTHMRGTRPLITTSMLRTERRVASAGKPASSGTWADSGRGSVSFRHDGRP
jgi:hypothetical protein